MYRVKRNEYKRHIDATNAAKSESKLFPVRLRSDSGTAWYWRGRYCGMHFRDLAKAIQR